MPMLQGDQPTSPLSSPSTKAPHQRRRNLLVWAVLTLLIILATLSPTWVKTFDRLGSKSLWLVSNPPSVEVGVLQDLNDQAQGPSLVPLISDDSGPFNPEILDVTQLERLVSQTKGFFTRDIYLGEIGWNNIRYIIEAALMNAKLLNRTLIIPSFILARGCTYESAVCDSYAQTVMYYDWPLGDDKREDRWFWQIPITAMVDLPQLRHAHPVITIAEYLRLHNLSESLETINGSWSRSNYFDEGTTANGTLGNRPSLFLIEQEWYQPGNRVRVDEMPRETRMRGGWDEERVNLSIGHRGDWDPYDMTQISEVLHDALLPRRLYNHLTMPWEKAYEALLQIASQMEGGWLAMISSNSNTSAVESQTEGHTYLPSDDEVTGILEANGWEVLHTYRGAQEMEHSKQMSKPIREVVPRWSIRGLKDDFDHIDADVLLLAGVLHFATKPGLLRFTTAEARDNFSHLVFQYSRPISQVRKLARLLGERMEALNEGRMFVGAHMRRNDFLTWGWVVWPGIDGHLGFVLRFLEKGKELWDTGVVSMPHASSAISRSAENDSRSLVPLPGDKFFIATDEKNPGNLTFIQSQNAVLSSQLITIQDMRNFGWPLMFDDVISIVEQATLARACFFLGDAISSWDGGVMNMRTALGWDIRTGYLESSVRF